jgi:uncharacterized secreted repeat protein (TIGR03808 family)
MTQLPLSRRVVVGGFLALGTAFVTAPAQAQALDPIGFGLEPDAGTDVSSALQTWLDAAARAGQPAILPAGTYVASGIILPANLVLRGTPGATILVASAAGAILSADSVEDIVLEDLVLDGSAFPRSEGDGALLEIRSAERVHLNRLQIRGSGLHGIGFQDSAATITDCDITNAADAGLFSIDSRGLIISGNRISDCGNGGVLIWRSANGPDGSIVSGNQIARIDWRGGGNGQNGNGVNVFRADEVIISDNHISDCAFSAIRLNSTNNTQIRGNGCFKSGEIAIYSEFAFTGSVIADNIIDGAAQGISITNFDQGGRLAVCSGNLVRNIAPRSENNPDAIPIGLYAEADTLLSGNVVEAVPGVGIAAGYGPFLRNVSITDNLVSQCQIGIGVSVVEEAGPVRIDGNMVTGSQDSGIVGLAWSEVVTTDLAANTPPNVTMGDNTVVA